MARMTDDEFWDAAFLVYTAREDSYLEDDAESASMAVETRAEYRPVKEETATMLAEWPEYDYEECECDDYCDTHGCYCLPQKD